MTPMEREDFIKHLEDLANEGAPGVVNAPEYFQQTMDALRQALVEARVRQAIAGITLAECEKAAVKENAKSCCKVAGAAAGRYLVWTGIKWVVAGTAAPETGGLSLVGAAACP